MGYSYCFDDDVERVLFSTDEKDINFVNGISGKDLTPLGFEMEMRGHLRQTRCCEADIKTFVDAVQNHDSNEHCCKCLGQAVYQDVDAKFSDRLSKKLLKILEQEDEFSLIERLYLIIKKMNKRNIHQIIGLL